MKIYKETIPLSRIQRNTGQIAGLPKNPRKASASQIDRLAKSLAEDSELLEARPLLVYPLPDGTFVAVGGNMRLEAAARLGWSEIPCAIIDASTPVEVIRRYLLKDNAAFGEWDYELLAQEWDAGLLFDCGVDIPETDVGEFDGASERGFDIKDGKGRKGGNLSARYIVPPFSVIRLSKLITAKNAWVEKYKSSTDGRKKGLLGNEWFGTSEFHPTLAEIFYKWFNVDGGRIIDPFAGGCVRGFVAGDCGYDYTGIDIRKEQIDANEKVCKFDNVRYLCGDSNSLLDTLASDYDFVFSCPPYADLEVYSDLAGDISNKPYDEFLRLYSSIIAKAVERLKDNRFACFVVGDVRDKAGYLRNFVGDTIRAFEAAGMRLYNQITIENAYGSATIRANRFMRYRKVVNLSQYALVFYKGDISAIPATFPDLGYKDDDPSFNGLSTDEECE